ncbi:MAG: histidine kinase [Bacteroidales bacterium]|nr:histidine kinase [Bacteroidales bacterium]
MKRRNIILIHLLFWFYIINQSLFPLYIGKLDESMMANNKYLTDVFISNLLNLITFYPIYLLFPRLLKFKRRVAAVFTGLMVIALLTVFRSFGEFYVWKYFIPQSGKEMTLEAVYMWNNLRMVIIIGIYAILIRFMINGFESQKLRDELINKQQASELALMRSQVNPHFLFNTLNNIYSLVYRKSDEAPEAVMKLSSIMRYMLYDSASPKVPLEKELEYLKSFIELQNLRIKHPDFVSLKIEGNTEDLTIAPMLLISFVENAFKHSSKLHRPGIIVHLSTLSGNINFEVINHRKKEDSVNDEPSAGIGMTTIRRRLELIYPGKHKLVIKKDEETYRIHLEINT